MGAAEREAKGRRFSSMVIDTFFRPKTLGVETSGDSRIHRYTYKFVKTLAVDSTPFPFEWPVAFR